MRKISKKRGGGQDRIWPLYFAEKGGGITECYIVGRRVGDKVREIDVDLTKSS